jgi:hypothetical protein
VWVMRTGLLSCAAVAVLVLLTAACGGGGERTTTAAGGTSPAEWANGVCSSVTTWKQSLESIKDTVASQPSPSQLRRAGRKVERATETLARSLKELGTPETAQGEAAKKSLDTLATSLQNGMNKLEQTLGSSPSGVAGTLAQISALTATLSSMAHALELAGGNLKDLAPGDELEQAFHQASACKSLVNQTG